VTEPQPGEGWIQPDLEIALENMRTLAEEAVRKERTADLRSTQRGKYIEQVLQRVNCPVYHYISIQARGRQVADVLVENQERTIDLLVLPLERFAKMALDAIRSRVLEDSAPTLKPLHQYEDGEVAAIEAMQQLPLVVQKLSVARALDMIEHGLDTPLPDLPERGNGLVSLAEASRKVVESTAGSAAAVQQSVSEPSTSVPPPRAPITEELEGARVEKGSSAKAKTPQTPEQDHPEPGRKTAAVVSRDSPQEKESAASEAAVEPGSSEQGFALSTEISEEGRDVLRMLGEGSFSATDVVRAILDQGLWMAMAAGSRKRVAYAQLAILEKRGLVEKRPVELNVDNKVRSGFPKELVTLTRDGQATYRQMFNAEPVDRQGPFIAKYKTYEAGVLIRIVRKILEDWNERKERHWWETRHWTYEVIDAVWEPEEAFSRISGSRRVYTCADGSSRAYPDLIVQMTPRAGKPVVVVVEVERGLYNRPDLEAKWDRAMQCYPPLPLYVVAPQNKTRDVLKSAWMTVLKRHRERYGFSHECFAAFYTPTELLKLGMWSPDQLEGLKFRQAAHKRGELEIPEREQKERVPFFWKEKATGKGEQLELDV